MAMATKLRGPHYKWSSIGPVCAVAFHSLLMALKLLDQTFNSTACCAFNSTACCAFNSTACCACALHCIPIIYSVKLFYSRRKEY